MQLKKTLFKSDSRICTGGRWLLIRSRKVPPSWSLPSPGRRKASHARVPILSSFQILVLEEAEGAQALEKEHQVELSLPFSDAGGDKFFNLTPLASLQTSSLPPSLLRVNGFNSSVGLATFSIRR